MGNNSERIDEINAILALFDYVQKVLSMKPLRAYGCTTAQQRNGASAVLKHISVALIERKTAFEDGKL